MNTKSTSLDMDKKATTQNSNWIADLMAASHIGLLLCDVPSDCSIVDLNSGFEVITDMKRADLVGKSFFTIFSDIDPATAERLQFQETGGEKVLLEYFCRKTGRYLEIHAHRVSDDQVAMLIHNITARKQAEDVLQRNESLFLTTQRLAKIGGWELDLENMTTYWTDEVYRIHDMEPSDFSSIDEAVEVSLECYQPADRTAVMEAFKRCAEEGVAYDQEYPFITTKGRHTWIRTIASPIKEDGKIVKIVGYLMDISDQKLMEREKLLLERQVQHSQKLESLGLLAGGIAHDFNNLLMGVIGNVDLALLKTAPSDALRGHLEEIEKAASGAAELAQQMLAYSGRGSFEAETVDLSALTRDTAHLLEATVTKKARLIYDLAGDLPPIIGDPAQLRQVLMNLITNASEALGDNEGEIVLSTGTQRCSRSYLDSINATLLASLDKPLPEGLYAYIDVRDTGCGMDAATVERIFDPFFTTKFTGRGLGMSSVLGILCGHKGAIKIASEVGRGTSFRVLLPATDCNSQPSQPEPIESSEPAPPHEHGTILVVDDEDAVLKVASHMVSKLGYETLEATDGSNALEVFREHSQRISCLLLDFQMPRMNGLETLRAIRSLAPGIKAIISSGYNEMDLTDALDLEPVAFIHKPYRMAQLEETLAKLLNSAGGSD